MSVPHGKHAAYQARHRGAPERPLAEGSRKAARNILISALAVGGTGAGVVGGMSLYGAHPAVAAAAHTSSTDVVTTVADRPVVLSRSFDRTAADPAKQAVLGALTETDDTAVTGSEDIAGGDPESIAAALLSSYGWDGAQFGCLVSLWNRESHWNVHAANPSGAYGIPQALPGSKMASAGADWQDSAETQIKWGLGYIRERYGSPCGAWGHSESHGWY